MQDVLRTLVFVAGALVVLWFAMIAVVWLVRPDDATVSDAARLLPDTLRVVGRLASDAAIPRRTRVWVWALLVYLALPIDLIPDLIPVIGYADDAIITSFVLRHVIARCGPAKLEEYWPGPPAGLALLRKVLRLPLDG